MNFTTKLVTAVSGEAKEKQTEGASPNSGKAKSELTDVTKALKRKLSEKVCKCVCVCVCVCVCCFDLSLCVLERERERERNQEKRKLVTTRFANSLLSASSLQMIRASTASYRSFRAAVKEGQSAVGISLLLFFFSFSFKRNLKYVC